MVASILRSTTAPSSHRDDLTARLSLKRDGSRLCHFADRWRKSQQCFKRYVAQNTGQISRANGPRLLGYDLRA
jgi:hypothetical protein